MKTLSTEAQAELQKLFDDLVNYTAIFASLPIQEQAQINYWKNELKPKRVRRNKVEAEGGNE